MLLIAAPCLRSFVPGAAGAQQSVRGIRFCLDAIEMAVAHRGPLIPVGGRVEFADDEGAWISGTYRRRLAFEADSQLIASVTCPFIRG